MLALQEGRSVAVGESSQNGTGCSYDLFFIKEQQKIKLKCAFFLWFACTRYGNAPGGSYFREHEHHPSSATADSFFPNLARNGRLEILHEARYGTRRLEGGEIATTISAIIKAESHATLVPTLSTFVSSVIIMR